MPSHVDFYIKKKKGRNIFSFQSVAQAGLELTQYLFGRPRSWILLAQPPVYQGLKAETSSTVSCLFPGLSVNGWLHSHMGLYVKLGLDLNKSFQ